MNTLFFLLIDDDQESLDQMQRSLPTEICGSPIEWDYCVSFDVALKRLSFIRYDMVVTDIYIGKVNPSTSTGEAAALKVVNQLRETRFCPIVAFTSASPPVELKQTNFLRVADKSQGDTDLLKQIEGLLESGIPQSIRNMHDALDRTSSTYLWEFLDAHWSELSEQFTKHQGLLERLVRRRGAVQLTRMNEEGSGERGKVEGVEYYICPPIAADELRMGEVIRHRTEGWLRVILTPHCHLTVQPKETAPRAEKVLTVLARPVGKVYNRIKLDAQGIPQNPWGGNEQEKEDKLRRRVGIPASQLGRPDGRFWFLPGFLEIPDSYCDFMEAQSIPHNEIMEHCDRLAVLDAPFAESLQSLFTQFYASIGTPVIEVNRYKHLMNWEVPGDDKGHGPKPK